MAFYTLRICRISCKLRERFELPNAVVTEMYEILHAEKERKARKLLV